jgi:hypothetical protein
VSSEALPLPLGFFEEALPPLPEDWRSRRCAFLRFSEGYQEPARQAAARGWPVRDLPGGLGGHDAVDERQSWQRPGAQRGSQLGRAVPRPYTLGDYHVRGNMTGAEGKYLLVGG